MGKCKDHRYARLSEPGGRILRSNRALANRWYSRDVFAIGSTRGIAGAAPFFIDVGNPVPNPWGLPVGWLAVLQFSNAHKTCSDCPLCAKRGCGWRTSATGRQSLTQSSLRSFQQGNPWDLPSGNMVNCNSAHVSSICRLERPHSSRLRGKVKVAEVPTPSVLSKVNVPPDCKAKP